MPDQGQQACRHLEAVLAFLSPRIETGTLPAPRGKTACLRQMPIDITAALATLNQGIAAVPLCGLTYNAAARLLIAQGRPAAAKTKLDALVKIAPNSDGAVIAKEILASLSTKP
jgi:hypothetical protein